MTISNPFQPDKAPGGKIVLHDECGDSLWDEVLAQHEDTLPSKKQGVDQRMLNRISIYKSATVQLRGLAPWKPIKYSMTSLKVL